MGQDAAVCGLCRELFHSRTRQQPKRVCRHPTRDAIRVEKHAKIAGRQGSLSSTFEDIRPNMRLTFRIDKKPVDRWVVLWRKNDESGDPKLASFKFDRSDSIRSLGL